MDYEAQEKNDLLELIGLWGNYSPALPLHTGWSVEEVAFSNDAHTSSSKSNNAAAAEHPMRIAWRFFPDFLHSADVLPSGCSASSSSSHMTLGAPMDWFSSVVACSLYS